MRLLQDLSAFDWIAASLADTGPETNGTVAHCLPSIFPSYVKIYHSIFEDISVQDRKMTWQEEEQGRVSGRKPTTDIERKIAEVLSRSTLVYGGASPDACLKRIRWAELAERLGTHLTPTFSASSFTRRFPGASWPRHLIGPQEGCLAHAERDALTSVLRAETGIDRVFFRFWILATTGFEGDKIFEGTLDEARLFPDKQLGVDFTPTHWFPEDRSWMVCTDYDLTFSLVGGSERLICELLAHPALECMRVSSMTRVDSNADLQDTDG